MTKESKKKIKIIITGGGTGGHIVPLMAVVEELKKRNSEILYLGSGIDLEKQAAEKEGIKYKSVLSGKFKRYFSFDNFLAPFKILIGIIQSFFIIIFNWPDVIFAKGGYVTFPVVFAGWMLGRPIITHESDVVMGLANRWEAKFAKKICVGFPADNYPDIPLGKIIYTGNPVRKEFLKSERSDTSFTSTRTFKTILVTGGSQGSRFINQTVAAILKYLTNKYHVIHICGKTDYEWLTKNRWPNYDLYDFTEKIPEFMEKSDLIISRSGANTLAEISILGKSSILIPLPTSANNHQLINAKIYEKNNAAVLVTEKGLTPDNLRSIIEHLMKDDKMRHEMGKKSKALSQPDAADAIAKEIIEIIK